MITRHTPVLLQEVIDSLGLGKGKTFLDGTLGGGGHSAHVAETFGDAVRIIGLDRDPDALGRAEERLRTLGARFDLKETSFRHLDVALRELGVEKVDAILLDLGISSDQLDVSGRGFSFRFDEPLDMRMSREGLTAADVLNEWDEETLSLILKGFGEERYARRIARQIALRRIEKPFRTTFDLLEAVRAATPIAYHHGRIHFATRTFQALRIAVNEELTALEEGLEKGFKALAPGGRFAVISFHSLEDRIVKNFFRDRVKEEQANLLTKKPIVPQEKEIDENPRSRSAKLRVLEKVN